MATIALTPEVDPTHLDVTFTRLEKTFGFVSDLHVPLSEVTGARAEDPWKTLRGIRAPGLGLPRKRLIGHWWGRGRHHTIVSVTYRQPAVRVTLTDVRRSLLIGADDAEGIAARISAALTPTA